MNRVWKTIGVILLSLILMTVGIGLVKLDPERLWLEVLLTVIGIQLIIQSGLLNSKLTSKK